jgi:Holliday junction resolvase RusA-like endonuclease
MKFFTPCLPIAQPRPKATTINGSARMYAAKASHPIHAFKAGVRLAWADAGAEKIDGPILATIVCRFPRPAKVPKKLGTDRIAKSTKPDLDNLAKGVLDALNGLAYHDDGQVCELKIVKYHAAEGETPGVLVELKPESEATNDR